MGNPRQLLRTRARLCARRAEVMVTGWSPKPARPRFDSSRPCSSGHCGQKWNLDNRIGVISRGVISPYFVAPFTPCCGNSNRPGPYPGDLRSSRRQGTVHCNRRCSSTEERRPVTSEVAGSAPASGAKLFHLQVVKWTSPGSTKPVFWVRPPAWRLPPQQRTCRRGSEPRQPRSTRGEEAAGGDSSTGRERRVPAARLEGCPRGKGRGC